MAKSQRKMAEEQRADELLEDLERLAEMFDKHDRKLQSKVTDTLKETVQREQETHSE